jgi:hypothetical protein
VTLGQHGQTAAAVVDRFLAGVEAVEMPSDVFADDRVSTDTAFCGGRWPADLIAEMEAAATTTDA